MRQQTFWVQDIHCDGCRRTIRDALGDVDGLERVDADIECNTVAVTYDEQRVGSDLIATLLADAGFPVQSVTAETAHRNSDVDDAGIGSAGARYLLLSVALVLVGVAGYVGTSCPPLRPPSGRGCRPSRPGRRSCDRVVLLPMFLPAAGWTAGW